MAAKKKSMEETLEPDEGIAGTVPVAVLLGMLPKFLQDFIKFGIKILEKAFKALIDAILKTWRGQDKTEAKESYSTHASFDVLQRLDNIEFAIAMKRGELVNKIFKPSTVERLFKLEKMVGIRPPKG